MWRTVTYSPATHLCLPASPPSHMYGIQLPLLTFDVLVIILIVIKARENSATLGSGTPIVCRVT